MDEIFISIASYRDEFLPFTIRSALGGARFPERLRFGICWQAADGETLDPYLDDPRFRIAKFPYWESQGYGWSRAEVQKLYRGEAYHLLIDSHSYLAPGWDENLIAQLQSKPSPRPLLTTSAPPFTFDGDGKVVFPYAGTARDGVPMIRCGQHSPYGFIDFQMSDDRSPGPNTPTYLMVCNFVFTLGGWIVDVPEDPNMINACHESALAVRTYTHGYDMFLPDEIQVWHLLYHNYGEGYRRTVWETKSQSWQVEATKRMRKRLDALVYGRGDPAFLGRYGRGTARSVEEWAAKAGVDLRPVSRRSRRARPARVPAEGARRQLGRRVSAATLNANADAGRLQHVPAAPTIFVAIASYTDPELPRTLRDASALAQRPDALRFGICWQADPAAPVPLDEFRRDSRFRFVDTTIHASQGGPWARNIAQSLWRGELYTLQIDSHMKFEPGWDGRLIEMLERLPSAKPIVTMNAPLFWYDDDGVLQRRFDMGVPTTKVTRWSEADGWAPWLDFGPPNVQQPGRTRFVNGNFAFTRGVWNVEVPQDPEHYYWGEEFNITVRSFTSGYDFFLPSEVVAWHMLHRGGPPRRHWEHGAEVVQRRNATALARLAQLLFEPNRASLAPYSLGRARTLRDYEIYAGFDFRRRRAHPEVLTGANPDPVTIRSQADWDRCVPWAELRAGVSL